MLHGAEHKLTICGRSKVRTCKNRITMTCINMVWPTAVYHVRSPLDSKALKFDLGLCSLTLRSMQFHDLPMIQFILRSHTRSDVCQARQMRRRSHRSSQPPLRCVVVAPIRRAPLSRSWKPPVRLTGPCDPPRRAPGAVRYYVRPGERPVMGESVKPQRLGCFRPALFCCVCPLWEDCYQKLLLVSTVVCSCTVCMALFILPINANFQIPLSSCVTSWARELWVHHGMFYCTLFYIHVLSLAFTTPVSCLVTFPSHHGASLASPAPCVNTAMCSSPNGTATQAHPLLNRAAAHLLQDMLPSGKKDYFLQTFANAAWPTKRRPRPRDAEPGT